MNLFNCNKINYYYRINYLQIKKINSIRNKTINNN